MRKPDDDLKIDIADLFGGAVSGPSEQLEEAAAIEAAPAGAASPAESQFQEWMTNRNAELEAKTLELEKKFQEAPAAPLPSPAPADHLSGGELLSAPTEPVAPAATTASPIDFSAPIAPPFMGPTTTPASPDTGETPAPAEGPAAPPDAEELKRLQADYEFLMLYDEFRNIIVFELKDLVGEKKTLTMLGRTVELAREKFPEIFRNANWDSTGNLLEDGSVDSQRIIENKNSLEPSKADVVLDTALSTLLRLRLQAVEKGLGTGLKNKVRAHLYQWISEKTQKAVKEGKNALNLKRLSGYIAST